MKWLFPFVATLLASLPSMASVNGQTVRGTLLQNANEFLVALLARQKGVIGWRFVCTGALIHKNFVLTSGHCLEGGFEYGISFFRWSQKGVIPSDFLVAKEFVRHPDWNRGFESQNWQKREDVGLVTIPDAPEWARPVPFADYVWEPQQIPPQIWARKVIQLWDTASVITFDRDQLASNVKAIRDIHRVNLEIRNSGPKGSNWEGFVVQSKSAQLATAVCGGDSGAPVVKVRNGQFFLVGVIMAGAAMLNKPVIDQDGKPFYMKDTFCGDTQLFNYPDEEMLERWMADFFGAINPRVYRVH